MRDPDRSRERRYLPLQKLRLDVFAGRFDVTQEEIESADRERPRVRADCVDGPRPCPWVGCRNNVYLDASEQGEGITLSGELDGEPGDVPPDKSCVLDMADHGGMTLEEVGEVLGNSRERVRQIQDRGIRFVLGLSSPRYARQRPQTRQAREFLSLAREMGWS